jgi:hypothetical protein
MVGLAVLVAVGCSFGEKVTTKSSSELPRYHVRTMALVPFSAMATPQARDLGNPYMSTPQGIRRSDISIAVPSNAEPPLRQTVMVPDYAADLITQLFWSRLKSREGITVSSPNESAKLLSVNGESTKNIPETTGAEIAKRLQVDAVLIGQVLVFQERVGSRLGANPPASVGFEVKAVTLDGSVLWVGNYYERQKPMTEDFMGFVQRWGAFVTAEELAQYGVDQIMKEFPFGSVEK